MQKEIMFAGFGGQGILSAAKILAMAAMKEGFEVAWIPSYGPEMRGGTAYCTVMISDKPIGSPIVQCPKYLVAMNLPSYEKFAPCVQKGGLIIANSTLIPMQVAPENVEMTEVDTVAVATEAGSARSANIAALAAFVAKSGIISEDSLKQSLEEQFAKKPELIPINIGVMEASIKAVQ